MLDVGYLLGAYDLKGSKCLSKVQIKRRLGSLTKYGSCLVHWLV